MMYNKKKFTKEKSNMMLSKNEIVRIEITDISSDGNGVGHYDGIAVFVPFSAVGDLLDVIIVKVEKSFVYGKIEKIITPSESRIPSDCSAYERCGGCTLRHISYEAELEVKSSAVKNAFRRIGKLDIPFDEIFGSEQTDMYRNKAQYPVAKVGNKATFGFYAKRSHRVVPSIKCLLQPELFNEIADFSLESAVSKGISPYDEETHTGILRHIFIRRGFHTGEIMLCFVVRKPCERELLAVSKAVCAKYPDIVSCVMNVNPDRTNVILGRKTSVIFGKEYITDVMCGNRIRLAPEAFYQVNTPQAEKLYELAKDYAELSGDETLLDLYCGAGTIGLSMAHSVRKVIGVEIVPEAVENARINARENGIENAEFFCGDAGITAEKLTNDGIVPDVIVLDPARKGCDDAAIEAVLKMSPKKIVMISCNPATAARDCAKICAGGYNAVKARAADLFPRTSHVECVVLLAKQHI